MKNNNILWQHFCSAKQKTNKQKHTNDRAYFTFKVKNMNTVLNYKKQSMHSICFILQFLDLMPYTMYMYVIYLQCLLKGLRILMPIHIAFYLSVLTVLSEQIKWHQLLYMFPSVSNNTWQLLNNERTFTFII